MKIRHAAFLAAAVAAPLAFGSLAVLAEEAATAERFSLDRSAESGDGEAQVMHGDLFLTEGTRISTLPMLAMDQRIVKPTCPAGQEPGLAVLPSSVTRVDGRTLAPPDVAELYQVTEHDDYWQLAGNDKLTGQFEIVTSCSIVRGAGPAHGQ